MRNSASEPLFGVERQRFRLVRRSGLMSDPAHRLSGGKGPRFRKVGGGRTDRGKEETILDKPKAAREQGAGRAASKSDAIRQMAREMVLKGQPPRPRDIVAALREQGIEVLSSQVSTALRETEFALRQLRVDWERPPVLFPEPAMAFQLVGLEDVQKAKKFVLEIGSLEKAMAALVAFKQFGGEQVAATERTDAPVLSDCRWPEGEKAGKPTS
jgi:hypothetical protein